MLGTIFGSIVGPLLDKIIAPLLGIAQAYISKQITEAQLREQLQAVLVGAVQAIEVEHAEALAKTYASFMDTLKGSQLMQRVWAAVVLSQLFVLVWSQFAVPLLFAFSWLPSWKAGTSAEWAYLLIGFCLGAGPVVLRSGPGAGQTASNIAGALRSMVGGK